MEHKTMSTRPLLYNYRKSQSYVKDVFNFIKAKTSDYTIRGWAIEMGLDSPRVLIEILEGKRPIKLKYSGFLAKGLKLNTHETAFFESMIMHENAKTEIEKRNLEILMKHLSENDDAKGAREVEPREEPVLFSHWTHSLLLSLGRLKKNRLNIKKLKGTLRHEAEESQIQESLKVLSELGHIDIDESGYIVNQRTSIISTPTDVFHSGGRLYAQQMSELAKKATEFPLEEREFQCFSLCINEGQVLQFKEMIRAFRRQLMSFADESGDSVYQVNLQFFPLTQNLASQEAFDSPQFLPIAETL